MQATAPAMAVLAEDELERISGGFRRCGALQAFREKEPKVAVERSAREEGCGTAGRKDTSISARYLERVIDPPLCIVPNKALSLSLSLSLSRMRLHTLTDTRYADP
jgi:hypothetical protein